MKTSFENKYRESLLSNSEIILLDREDKHTNQLREARSLIRSLVIDPSEVDVRRMSIPLTLSLDLVLLYADHTLIRPLAKEGREDRFLIICFKDDQPIWMTKGSVLDKGTTSSSKSSYNNLLPVARDGQSHDKNLLWGFIAYELSSGEEGIDPSSIHSPLENLSRTGIGLLFRTKLNSEGRLIHYIAPRASSQFRVVLESKKGQNSTTDSVFASVVDTDGKVLLLDKVTQRPGSIVFNYSDLIELLLQTFAQLGRSINNSELPTYLLRRTHCDFNHLANVLMTETQKTISNKRSAFF